ncbi:hypothetical protein [Mycobacterium interjectum]|uniref:hypothetical protein n=1 Tax=Mycobacterium interjectum TaxID=33895 RepID=UPI000836A6FF|nr:hypothetical protein [Mycobacterium interjectum]MCV7090074.1 hypothetical protein [Mycobacterium interjectum]
MSTSDLSRLPVTVWKAKLANLRSHYADDTDPRVAEALAGLGYWRFRKHLDHAVETGLIDQTFADAVEAKVRWYDPDERADDAGGECEVSERAGSEGAEDSSASEAVAVSS